MGNLFVVSGPSAVGKTSVVNAIMEKNHSIQRIVTCTSRERRKTEKDGIDYYFLEKKGFLARIEAGEFIEFSEVYGDYYGVTLSTIKESIRKDGEFVLTIDWQGFLKIKSAIKEKVWGIFILPPSLNALEIRIKARGEDSPESIAIRIEKAKEEIAQSKHYDFCFENSEIDSTAENILKTITSIKRKNAIL
ncbi:MAG: guanylate kinase [Holosporaceae bacterium]|jgi:guanylate kinase|nr:guanylate kinase [Holosporaceae bacterium]